MEITLGEINAFCQNEILFCNVVFSLCRVIVTIFRGGSYKADSSPIQRHRFGLEYVIFIPYGASSPIKGRC